MSLLLAVALAATSASAGPRLIVRFDGADVEAAFAPHSRVAKLARDTGIDARHVRRMAEGAQLVELPAGMIDGDSNFAGVAAKEIEEELGMVIKQTELTCLTDKVGEIRRARNTAKEAGSSSSGSGHGA